LHQSLQFQGQRLCAVEVHLAAGQSNGEILPSLVDSEQVQLVVAPREKTTQHLLAPLPRAHDVQILTGIESRTGLNATHPIGIAPPNRPTMPHL